MDRRERKTTQEEVLRAAFQGMQARIWTALVGVVQSYNVAAQTVVVQPAVNGKALQPDGTWKATQMPLLLDCPVLFQGGGGCTLTFPIEKDDECLVIVSSRCIDTWFAQGFSSGGSTTTPNLKNNPPEYRMHNLSDGFALVGVKSIPHALTVDPVSACLMTNDGAAYFKLNPDTHAITALAPGGFNVTASGGVNINGVTIDSSANVATAGDVTSKGKVLATHIHADPQGGNVGPPL
jgi:hypothetical protein